MRTTHHTFSLATQTVHCIDFSPDTLTPADLLWLPHHAALACCSRKRQAEHLAGRIAAVHALREFAITSVPAIGGAGQPCWPSGLFGSISHSGTRAIAVVANRPVGVDTEALFSDALCAQVSSSIVNEDEYTLLKASALPFPLALTLAFSAKESLFKAFSDQALPLPGFASAKIISLDPHRLTLQILPGFSAQLADYKVAIAWKIDCTHVVTLCLAPSPDA